MIMKTLNLIITQKYFDQIMAGTKKKEYREVKPTTIKKLLQLDSDGYEIEDDKGNAQPIKYDAIQFYVGYRKDRDTCIVEVKDSHCEIFTDEEGNPIIYRYDGLDWVEEQVVYDLGRITYCNNKKYHYDRLNDPLCYPEIQMSKEEIKYCSWASDLSCFDWTLIDPTRAKSRAAFERLKNIQISGCYNEEAACGNI